MMAIIPHYSSPPSSDTEYALMRITTWKLWCYRKSWSWRLWFYRQCWGAKLLDQPAPWPSISFLVMMMTILIEESLYSGCGHLVSRLLIVLLLRGALHPTIGVYVTSGSTLFLRRFLSRMMMIVINTIKTRIKGGTWRRNVIKRWRAKMTVAKTVLLQDKYNDKYNDKEDCIKKCFYDYGLNFCMCSVEFRIFTKNKDSWAPNP